MDLIRILTDSIRALPQGEYTPGLEAILRHITIAFRHYDGGADPSSDRFTDAIYRTNQAYEGSLKEAYRVLAGRDPAHKTPNDIEKYLNDNKILRQRVLTQITRYRQDYRNPSTHDYRLDFDQSEALLAILSTCGFAKLLIDQISEKLAYNEAKRSLPDKHKGTALAASSIEEAGAIAANLAASFLNETQFSGEGWSLTGALSGIFASAGFSVENERKTCFEDIWDIFLKVKDFSIPVEVRVFGEKFSAEDSHGLAYLVACMIEEGFSAGINVVVSRNSDRAPVKSYLGKIDDKHVFVVSNYDIDDLQLITSHGLQFIK